MHVTISLLVNAKCRLCDVWRLAASSFRAAVHHTRYLRALYSDLPSSLPAPRLRLLHPTKSNQFWRHTSTALHCLAQSLFPPSGSPSSPRPQCFTTAATSLSPEGPSMSGTGTDEPPNAQVPSSDPQRTLLTGGSGFRTIRPGDVNLLTQVGSQETLELAEKLGR